MKITQEQLLYIGLAIILLFAYVKFIEGLLTDVQINKVQLSQKQEQFKTMLDIVQNLKINQSKILTLQGSLLNQINTLRSHHQLNNALKRIEIKKNNVIIFIKKANYQSLIRFLIDAKQYQILVSKIRLTSTSAGLVNGQLTLIH